MTRGGYGFLVVTAALMLASSPGWSHDVRGPWIPIDGLEQGPEFPSPSPYPYPYPRHPHPLPSPWNGYPLPETSPERPWYRAAPAPVIHGVATLSYGYAITGVYFGAYAYDIVVLENGVALPESAVTLVNGGRIEVRSRPLEPTSIRVVRGVETSRAVVYEPPVFVGHHEPRAVIAITDGTGRSVRGAVRVGVPLVLDGRDSRGGDGAGIVQWEWSRISGPGASPALGRAIATTRSYVVLPPLDEGVHRFRLVVEDENGSRSLPSETTIAVEIAGRWR